MSAAILEPGHPDYPPADVIAAAEKVGAWFANRNQKGWQLGPCADRFQPPAPASGSGDAGGEVRDAARYRWLRDPSTNAALVLDKRTGYAEPVEGLPGVGGYHLYEYRAGEELDAAIDAALDSQAARPGQARTDLVAELREALRWALRRIEHTNMGMGDRFAQADAVLLKADTAARHAPCARHAPADGQSATSAPESATSGATSASEAAVVSAALLKLCDQLDGMKRRLLHTPYTGQHHSYLMHEDVEAYVEEARRAMKPE